MRGQNLFLSEKKGIREGKLTCPTSLVRPEPFLLHPKKDPELGRSTFCSFFSRSRSQKITRSTTISSWKPPRRSSMAADRLRTACLALRLKSWAGLPLPGRVGVVGALRRESSGQQCARICLGFRLLLCCRFDLCLALRLSHKSPPFYLGGKRFQCPGPGNKLTLYHWKKRIHSERAFWNASF